MAPAGKISAVHIHESRAICKWKFITTINVTVTLSHGELHVWNQYNAE